MLSHYFRNQRELISFAFSLVIEEMHATLVTGSESLEPGVPRIRFLVNAFVPAPHETDPQAAVTLACWTLAAGDPELAHRYQAAYELIRLDAQQYVAEAIERGHIPVPSEAAGELADVVISFADGLMVGAILEPDRFTTVRLDAVIDQFIARLCAPSESLGPESMAR